MKMATQLRGDRGTVEHGVQWNFLSCAVLLRFSSGCFRIFVVAFYIFFVMRAYVCVVGSDLVLRV